MKSIKPCLLLRELFQYVEEHHMPGIEYVTPYTKLSSKDIRELIAQTPGDVEARIELILRSSLSGNGATLVEDKEAYDVAEAGLTFQPGHPIFNLISGCYWYDEKDKKSLDIKNIREKSLKHLLSALRSNDAAIQNHTGLFDTLRRCYAIDRDFIKASAWLLKLLHLGFKKAEDSFLLKKYAFLRIKDPDPAVKRISIMSEMILMMANFMGLDFPKDNKIKFLDGCGSPFKADLSAAFEATNNFQNLQSDSAPISKIIDHAIKNDMEGLYDFVIYCFEYQIISDPIYIEMLKRIAKKADQTYQDKANYKLFLYYFGKENGDECERCYNRISSSFKDFKVSDFQSMTQSVRDEICYFIFKRFFENKNHQDALPFLANVSDPQCFDEALFEFFHQDQRFERDFALFQMKWEVMQKIFTSSKLNESIVSKANQEIKSMDHPAYFTFIAMHNVISLFDEFKDESKQVVQQKLHLKMYDVLRSGEKTRTLFTNEIKNYIQLFNSPMGYYLPTNTLEIIHTILNTIQKGYQLFSRDKKYQYAASQSVMILQTLEQKLQAYMLVPQPMSQEPVILPPSSSQEGSSYVPPGFQPGASPFYSAPQTMQQPLLFTSPNVLALQRQVSGLDLGQTPETNRYIVGNLG